MNEKFYELPEEKQLRIINAGLEVFAINEYKRAVTDDIAAKAGISKGLLFYYFHNKKELYQFLFDYCVKIITAQVTDTSFYEITDFFDLLNYAARQKQTILARNPYIMDFIMKCYFADREQGGEEIQKNIANVGNSIFRKYFKNIDFSSFREDVEPAKIMRMMLWMAYGYMYERRLAGLPFTVDEIMKDFEEWQEMFKKIAYKEEYL